MTEDNWSRQADEVEALCSIFGDDWCVEDPIDRRYSVRITDESKTPEYTLQLQVTFSDEYPSDAPPIYELHAPWLRGEERKQLDSRIQETYIENIGEPVVFHWIDAIREFLDAKMTRATAEAASPEHLASPSSPDQDCSASGDVSTTLESFELSDKEGDNEVEDDKYGFDPALHVYRPPENTDTTSDGSIDGIPLPVIHHGEKVTDRKSVFQGHLAEVTHKLQVKMVLDSLKENRKIAAATHNINAFRIDGGNGVWICGCEDDGQIHAGSRMLHFLDIMNARNVMVVVTRWYGGIHLGPDRFKHINNCMRDLLNTHGYIKNKAEKNTASTADLLASDALANTASASSLTVASGSVAAVAAKNDTTAQSTAQKSKAKQKKKKKKNVSTSNTATGTSAATSATGDVDRTMEEVEKLEKENRQLKEARTCRVCMDCEINTVFLPCGHLVCCDECSKSLQNCPICRAQIRGTVKTYLS